MLLERLTGPQLARKFSILWNPKARYRTHKSPPTEPYQYSSCPPPHLLKIHFNIILFGSTDVITKAYHYTLPNQSQQKNKNPTRCHLLFYCNSYRLNMFRALLCPSSGARDYDIDYHIGVSFLVYCVLEVRCS